MVAAIQLLADEPGKRRIAVLGTMKELGEQSVELHRQVGEAIAQKGIDQLLTLADTAEAKAMVAGAGVVPSQQFESHEALAKYLEGTMAEGDRILFKASRSVEMDKVVDQLLNN